MKKTALIEKPFEIWQSPDKSATFYFSYSDDNLTTGILILKTGASLPKHNRPCGFENLVQVSGKCEMTVFQMKDPEKVDKIVDLTDNEQLRMQKGQWHIHANPYKETSITFFKLVGDITEIMSLLRTSNDEIIPKDK